MNKNFSKLFALLAGTLMLTACEETIPADKRYTPIANDHPVRSVLVEEYTGVKCVNCPNGHAALEAIEELYNTPANMEQGVGVVAVGIHIPDFGYSAESRPDGLVAPEAGSLTPDEVAPPQAQINRNSGLLDRNAWAKAVKETIVRPPKVTFVSSVLAEMRGNSIVISGKVHSAENLSAARLHVWIVEDNIVTRQLMPDGTPNLNYVHMNVVRGCVNGVKGSEFSMQRNSERAFSFTYAPDSRWKAENLRVVVFVETPADGVLNVTQNNLQINQ